MRDHDDYERKLSVAPVVEFDHVVRLLRYARQLLLDRNRWTQGACFRDSDGKSCVASVAACWSAHGAVVKAAWDLPEPWQHENEAIFLLDALCGDIDKFNSEHSYKEVMELFDQAIAARGEE